MSFVLHFQPYKEWLCAIKKEEMVRVVQGCQIWLFYSHFDKSGYFENQMAINNSEMAIFYFSGYFWLFLKKKMTYVLFKIGFTYFCYVCKKAAKIGFTLKFW